MPGTAWAWSCLHHCMAMHAESRVLFQNPRQLNVTESLSKSDIAYLTFDEILEGQFLARQKIAKGKGTDIYRKLSALVYIALVELCM